MAICLDRDIDGNHTPKSNLLDDRIRIQDYLSFPNPIMLPLPPWCCNSRAVFCGIRRGCCAFEKRGLRERNRQFHPTIYGKRFHRDSSVVANGLHIFAINIACFFHQIRGLCTTDIVVLDFKSCCATANLH